MNEFVIEVIKHGWLPRNPSYYYIDMECCTETLEDRIRIMGRNPLVYKGPVVNGQPEPAIAWAQLLPVLKIMHQMSSGLAYIHGKGVVHRDLKPRNGMFQKSS